MDSSLVVQRDFKWGTVENENDLAQNAHCECSISSEHDRAAINHFVVAHYHLSFFLSSIRLSSEIYLPSF